jgi:hypothetical protein
MATVLRTIAACAATAILWVVLQFVINAGVLYLAATRGEGEWWVAFMKNVISPGLSAYIAFSIVERFFALAPWKVLAGFFLLALLSYTAWSISFNSEHYLLANRTEEWRSVLWGTIISTVSAAVGCAVFLLPKLGGSRGA